MCESGAFHGLLDLEVPSAGDDECIPATTGWFDVRLQSTDVAEAHEAHLLSPVSARRMQVGALVYANAQFLLSTPWQLQASFVSPLSPPGLHLLCLKIYLQYQIWQPVKSTSHEQLCICCERKVMSIFRVSSLCAILVRRVWMTGWSSGARGLLLLPSLVAGGALLCKQRARIVRSSQSLILYAVARCSSAEVPQH